MTPARRAILLDDIAFLLEHGRYNNPAARVTAGKIIEDVLRADRNTTPVETISLTPDQWKQE